MTSPRRVPVAEMLASAYAQGTLTPQTLAEAVWLLERLYPDLLAPSGNEPDAPSADQPVPEQVPDPTAGPAPESAPAQSAPIDPTTPARQRDMQIVPARDGPLRSAPQHRTPASTALSESAKLNRALRSLHRKVRAPGGGFLDETATAHRSAEVGTLVPVWAPAVERWLDLTVLMDTSISMSLWRPTLTELTRMLRSHKAFRDVRIWSIDGDAEQPRLHASQPVGHVVGDRSPAELTDPTGRRLILIVTDGVGQLWQTAAMATVILEWADASPLTILNVLPERLWHRTSLPAVPALVHASPQHSGLLRSRTNRLHATKKNGQRLIPVVGLDPVRVGQWSSAVAGDRTAPQSMMAVPLPRPPAVDPHTNAGSRPTSTAELIKRFRLTASPSAYSLATFLSAAPLTVPVMRLIQRHLIPDSGPADLAEVFLSGLLVTIPGMISDEPDQIVYDFAAGMPSEPTVREELLANLPRTDAFRVLDLLAQSTGSEAEPLGGSLDFRTLVPQPHEWAVPPPESRPFAEVVVAVLTGLGGPYQELAESIISESLALDSPSAAVVTYRGERNKLLELVELCSGDDPRVPGPPEVRSVLAVLALSANAVVPLEILIDRVWTSWPPPRARELIGEYIARLREALPRHDLRDVLTLADRPGGYSLMVDPAEVDVDRFGQLLAERLPGYGSATLPPAVHRTIFVVDIEAFTDMRRTDANQVSLRQGVYVAIREAFRSAGIPWTACYNEDRGDGVLVLAPPTVPKALFVESLPHELVKALRRHNDVHIPPERLRLRAVLNAGEVHMDSHGVAGASVNTAFRLLDAGPVKAALTGSPAVLALVVSDWCYNDVVRQSPAARPETYRTVHVEVKETKTVAWVCLPDHPYAPGDPAPASRPNALVPRQLPPYNRHFVGRTEELRSLTELLGDLAANTNTVVITAIDGAAGMGTTTLAVHWANQVAGEFPDGQLYVNLRGFDPTGSPVRPAKAIHGFLGALGVPPEQIPADASAQAALYRTVLAGRRVLIVLDNAADSDQVRPLLPGGSSCFVVITTRAQLSSVITGESAHPLTLNVLSRSESRALLAQRLGRERLAAEPDAAAELIQYCGGLPLALAIVAVRAAMSPGLTLRALADELRDEQDRLDALDSGDLGTNARAVFSWSYQRLDTAAARMFRLLGLHPGPDFAASAAASLAGVPLEDAHTTLSRLVRANLIQERPSERFEFHDLLHAYAADQMDIVESATDRAAAMTRMFDYYLTNAHAADLLLDPHREPMSVAEPADGVVREPFTTTAEAWNWLDAEHPVLLAVIERAERTDHLSHTWQTLRSLATYLRRGGLWHDLTTGGQVALTAARRAHDRLGEAMTHSDLAYAEVRLGAFDVARTHLDSALDLHRAGQDQPSQARVRLELAWTCWQEGDLAPALEHAQQALALYRSDGHQVGEANALNDVGWYHAQLGDYQTAHACSTEALHLHRQIGNSIGQAASWHSLGYASQHLGDHQTALFAYTNALELYRDLGYRFNEAMTLRRIGAIHALSGDIDQARAAWQEALAIFERLGHATADKVRADIERLPQ